MTNLELTKQISFRIEQLKDDRKLTWKDLAAELGYKSPQALRQKMQTGYWPIGDLLKVAEFFKVPLTLFVVPEDEIDGLLKRKEPQEDPVVVHQAEIRAAKLEAELRARDRRIAELEASKAEPQGLEELKDICARQLKLAAELTGAVAEYMR